MPIRPELRHFYRTPEWFAAREAVRKRAGDRCENCGAKDGAVGYRGKQMRCFIQLTGGQTFPPPMQPDAQLILIQCGCCHRNGVAGDDRLENLAWWCRGCHLRHDKPFHRDTRAARKDRARPLLAVEGAA
jgi:hypothetical protein